MKNYLYLILFCLSSFIYADCSEINNLIDCENSDYCVWGDGECFRWVDDENEEWDDEEWEEEEWEDECRYIENEEECLEVGCSWGEEGCFKPEEDENLDDEQELIIGDITGDSSLNVLDVVMIVELILNNPSDEMHQADMNQDGITNILDVVALVQAILGTRTNDATMIEVIRDINHVMISSDGYVGAVQMILSHGDDFSIDLTNDALVAEYRTYNNSTTLIVVNPVNELFYANGEFEIIETIAANGNNFIDAAIIPSQITLGDAYPNPFNPSTTFDLQVAVAGHVSLNVYNLKGNVVGSLINNSIDPGNYNITWDASNLSSGIYLLRAETANSIATQKVTLVK